MKCKWGKDDVIVGRVVGKPKTEERWILGYLSFNGSPNRYVMISMSDGLVTKPTSQQYLAESLTDGEYLPEEILID